MSDAGLPRAGRSRLVRLSLRWPLALVRRLRRHAGSVDIDDFSEAELRDLGICQGRQREEHMRRAFETARSEMIRGVGPRW